MSDYTTQIRNYIEEICREDEYTPTETGTAAIDAKIEHAKSMIFDFDYPINSDDKDRFEHNFVRHFYMREIGAETIGLFKLFLADELNMLIPKYNKLWAENAKYGALNMFDNVALATARQGAGTRRTQGQTSRVNNDSDISSNTQTETQEGRTTNNSTSNKTGKTENLNKFLDTPQSTVDNIRDNSYLTNVTMDENENSEAQAGTMQEANTNERTANITGNHASNRQEVGTENADEVTGNAENETINGKNGGASYAELLLKLRETYVNIDLMLCNELEPLFMQIW